ncbi:AMP-binding protein [Streptomyces sp. NBC_00878]|uniref:AMP-binding protein n=1 Tax=Streptomyces sp. NBC_00878 TaxID=2975854 RepID=UPI002252B43D|nr:AMP-binding protein [Streptomyces sp. NBC_00878]MCX4904246.1 AMP-binding protein [Streptomyces sp. NBC_00878]
MAVACTALSRQTADGVTRVGVRGAAPVRMAFPPELPLREAALRIGGLVAGAGTISITTPNAESDLPERIELEVAERADGVLTLNGTCAQRQMDRLVHALRHEYRPASTAGEVPVACPADDEDLRAWAQNLAPIPATTLDRTFGRIARARPGRVAVHVPAGPDGPPGVRRLTYGEAEAGAVRLASALVRSGVQLGEPVVVVCDDPVRAVVDQLAVFKAGAVCVPVGRVAAEQAREIAALSGARWALCGSGSRLPWERHCRVLSPRDTVLAGLSGRARPGEAPVEDSLPRSDFTEAAYLLVDRRARRPAEARLSAHSAWTSATASRVRRAGHVSTEIVSGGDLAGAAALSAMWWAFACGARLTWLGDGGPHALAGVAPRAPGALPADVLLTTEGYQELLDTLDTAAAARSHAGLGTVVVSGTPCSADLVKQHFSRVEGTRLISEFSGDGGPLPWTARRLGPADAECRLLPNLGRPSPNVRVRVLDEAGRSLPPGLVGEICAEGDALPYELLVRDGVVVRTFTDHLLRSGRLGQLRRDGSLEPADDVPSG